MDNVSAAASKARVILPVCCRTSSRFNSHRFRYLIPVSCQLPVVRNYIFLLATDIGLLPSAIKQLISSRHRPAIFSVYTTVETLNLLLIHKLGLWGVRHPENNFLPSFSAILTRLHECL